MSDLKDLDRDELQFLRFNLEYGHKCRKSFLFCIIIYF